jgi:hypothetical protein
MYWTGRTDVMVTTGLHIGERAGDIYLTEQAEAAPTSVEPVMSDDLEGRERRTAYLLLIGLANGRSGPQLEEAMKRGLARAGLPEEEKLPSTRTITDWLGKAATYLELPNKNKT